MSESICQLIATKPAGLPIEVRVALAVLDSNINMLHVQIKAAEVVEMYLTRNIGPIAMAP